jgi:hypothetical protein
MFVSKFEGKGKLALVEIIILKAGLKEYGVRVYTGKKGVVRAVMDAVKLSFVTG